MNGSFAERLKIARTRAGLSQGELARRVGTSEQTCLRYEQGKTFPNINVADKIASLGGVSLQWLIRGEGGPDEQWTTEEDGAAYSPYERAAWIPYYDIRTRGGSGEHSIGEDPQEGYVPFNRTFLERHNIDYNNAACLEIAGDSMIYKLLPGDIVVVDLRIERWGQGASYDSGIYLVRLWGELMVKRIQRTGESAIELVSDNPVYRPIEVDLEAQADFEVIGRVKIRGGEVW